MAKELFLNQILTEQMIQAGETLIKRLDESEANVQAAFWVLEEERQTWKLIIVSPLVAEQDPRKYYQRIFDANDSAEPGEIVISPHNMEVDDLDNRYVRGIKNSILGEAFLGNNRLGGHSVGGVYISDMYLYRFPAPISADSLTQPKPIKHHDGPINTI